MKKIIIVFALIAAVFVCPCRSSAAESSLDIVLYDGLVGAGIGALAGAATLAFMDHPGDHLMRIPQGASIGLLCGIAFGVYEIRPVYYTDSRPDGSKEKVYGMVFSMPLK